MVNRLKHIPRPSAPKLEEKGKTRNLEEISSITTPPCPFPPSVRSDQTSTSCRSLSGLQAPSGPFLFVSLNEFMSPHCSSFPMAGGSQGSSLGYSFPNWKMSLRSPSTIEIQDFFFFFEKAVNSSGPVSRLQHHPIQSITKPSDLSGPTPDYGPGQAATFSPAWTVTTTTASVSIQA